MSTTTTGLGAGLVFALGLVVVLALGFVVVLGLGFAVVFAFGLVARLGAAGFLVTVCLGI
jgi:hypothetical protein